jgi:rod shape determining protein RodA
MEKRSLIHKIDFLWRGLDKTLGLIVLALVAISIVTFISATSGTHVKFIDQARNLIISIGVMLIVSRVPPKWLEKSAIWIYTIGIALLLAVAAFGLIRKGARRWVDVGIVIQPSEIMKIAMPMMLAWYFQRREGVLKTWDYGVAALLLILPVALIGRQPDLGTALLVLASGLYVIILAGFPWKYIIPVVGAGTLGILLIIIFGGYICEPEVKWYLLHEYQKNRVCTLLNPSSDPLGKGFHTIQSIIASGSGGLFGKGWLNGTQAHLEFIPEKHTDFIFAVFAEEFGLLGNIILLGLFVALIQRGLSISSNAPTLFTRLLGGSVTMIFFTYAFVNMGMVSGLLPVVGVPLPFISYGGTALVTLGIGIGILMSIHRHRRLVQS